MTKRETRRRSNVWLYLLGGLVLSCSFFAILLPKLPSSPLYVHIDMSASAGSSVGLYLNTVDIPPQAEPLVVGVRHTYTFAAPRGDITRITPIVATQAGVRVRVYSIYVTRGSKIEATFGPPELNTWAHYSLTTPTLTSDSLEMTSTAPSATIDAFRTVIAPATLPYPFNVLTSDSQIPVARLQICLYLMAILFLLLLFIRRRVRMLAVLLGVITVADILVLHELLNRQGPLGPVSEAVGNATYQGFSAETDTHALIGAAAVSLALSVGYLIVRRHRERAFTAGEPPGLQGDSSSRTDVKEPVVPLQMKFGRYRPIPAGWCVVVATLILGSAAFLPNLHASIRLALTQQFSPNWDTDNLLTWVAFAAHGLVPMKDFWYPYGNELFFSSSLIWGPLASFGYVFVSLGGYALAFWRLSSRRALITILALAMLVLLMPYLGEFSRYGVSLSIALVFCAVRSSDTRRERLLARALLTVIFGVALFTELDVAAYGAIGGLAALAFGEWPQVSTWRTWIRELLQDAMGPLIVTLVWVLVTSVSGQLRNYLHFYLHPGILTVYSTLPSALQFTLSTALSLDNVVIWAPAILFAMAIVLRFLHNEQRLLASILFGITGVTVPLLFKNAVRPITGDLFLPLIVAVLCLLIALTSWTLENRGRLTGLAAGAITGALLASALISGEWGALWPGVRALPSNLSSDITTLVSPPRDLARINAQRYSVAHFTLYPDVLSVERLLQPLMKRSRTDLYVLGDAPTLYLMLNQLPPWEINIYNTSPIEDQRRVISWIDQHRSEYVVLDNRNGQAFDGVPNPVRIPLVYQAVISRYVLYRTVGEFDILRRVSTEPQGSGAFWVNRLGSTLNLGAIPDSIPENVNIETSQTHAALQIETAAGFHGQVVVPLRFGSLNETVMFDAMAGRRQYEIPLNRLWPWALSTQVTLAGPLSSGLKATITKGTIATTTLY